MAAQEDKEVDEPKQLSQMEMKRIIDDMHKEKKEKSEEKKRVHCKYISEIDCVNVDAIIEGKLGQDKDKKGRPNYAYCFKVCMPHVLPMHQRTAQFQAMVTMTHMFTQLNQAIIHGVKLFEDNYRTQDYSRDLRENLKLCLKKRGKNHLNLPPKI